MPEAPNAIAIALKNQDAVTIAVLALGRIRNEPLTIEQAREVADRAVRDMKAVMEA